MTSTESLIESQRTELLELGFRQRHGFLYEIDTADRRRVAATIRADGVWVVEVFLWTEVRGFDPEAVDTLHLQSGTSMPVFRAVVGSLID